jgi:DNA-binding response OmpR family regulator
MPQSPDLSAGAWGGFPRIFRNGMEPNNLPDTLRVRQSVRLREQGRGFMRHLRVLFADGKQHVRDHFLSLFAQLGHQAAAAQDGKQLAEMCRTLRPDVLVIDEHLPDGSGLQAAAAGQESQTAIVLLTEAVGQDLLRRVEAERLVTACLVKPVNPSELEAATRIAARRSEEMRRVPAAPQLTTDAAQLLEHAERVIMRRAGVNVEEARHRLGAVGAAHGLGLPEAARVILQAEEAFALPLRHPPRAARHVVAVQEPQDRTASRKHASQQAHSPG